MKMDYTHGYPAYNVDMSTPDYVSDRFPAADPYAPLRALPAMELSSHDFLRGEKLPVEFTAPGGNISPELHWGPVPEGTKTVAVTCFDPDAPTTSGFWHWAVFNIPASVTSLPTNAGAAADAGIEGATTLINDACERNYHGPNPPAGHGPHRYIFTVWALPEVLDLPEFASNAALGFNLNFKATARGLYWGWYENPAQ